MLTYISLFSSAGVGCYGFKKEGFQCVVTNELLEKRLSIQKYNKKCKYEEGYVEGDITLHSTKEKIRNAIEVYAKKEKKKKLDIDVLIATPPCQGMSLANHKKGNELSRNSLVVESLKFTKEILPKFFIFENVSSFLKTTCTDIDGKDKEIKEAIEQNLGDKYNIYFDIINFKNYGSPSSRTRTLVIGTRKDLKEITPLDIFPSYENEKTLREVIGHLEALEEMGEISKDDTYHFFRNYDERMVSWIKATKEGSSAFDNEDLKNIPHQIKNGEIIINQNKNGDKYKRQQWDKVAPCIHTRNDILASQNTVHPSDNRVFSIRELMEMMSIPFDFKWTKDEINEVNNLSLEKKQEFLKRNELNIRHSIGEAVPTIIFRKIANSIKNQLEKKILTEKEVEEIIKSNQLDNFDKLCSYLKKHAENLGYINAFKISELANDKRIQTAAYYTNQSTAFDLVKALPLKKELKKEKIKILEPAVGVGNFIPQLLKKYESIEIEIDMFDINPETIEISKIILENFFKGSKIKFNYFCEDFLLYDFLNSKYDIIIGNPPYGKIIGDKKLLDKYKSGKSEILTNNLFAFFVDKSLELSKYVSLIIPKTILNSPEYNLIREKLEKTKIIKISDFGEKAFNVKIETIGITVETGNFKKLEKNRVEIESYCINSIEFKNQNYITQTGYNSWLIYRNEEFDKIAEKMRFGIFETFRDRQITNSQLTKDKREIRVLKSRNIGNNEIVDIEGYDCYMQEDDARKFQVYKYLNSENIVLIPNLSYNPRACFMPKNTIVNGSVALLFPKEEITLKDLEYYSTDEFCKFYRIARNYGTRTLNIDKNSVMFFGKKR